MIRFIPSHPYRFDLFYAIHARYPQASLFTLRDGVYYRALDHGGDLALVAIHADNGAIYAECLVGTVPESTLRHLLALDDVPTNFYAFAVTQPALWRVVEPLVGLPLYRSASLYEALIFVIIEQHIAWVNAQKAQRALVAWGDRHLYYEGQRYDALPHPEQLARATLDDLKPLKITFTRMNLLIHLSQQVVDGSLDLEAYAQLPPDDLYRALLAIKGVGHWTASVVLGRALGAYRYIPHNDVALQAAVAHYFDTEKDAQVTRTHFQQYGEFGGLAAHFTLMRWVLDRYPIV